MFVTMAERWFKWGKSFVLGLDFGPIDAEYKGFDPTWTIVQPSLQTSPRFSPKSSFFQGRCPHDEHQYRPFFLNRTGYHKNETFSGDSFESQYEVRSEVLWLHAYFFTIQATGWQNFIITQILISQQVTAILQCSALQARCALRGPVFQGFTLSWLEN